MVGVKAALKTNNLRGVVGADNAEATRAEPAGTLTLLSRRHTPLRPVAAVIARTSAVMRARAASGSRKPGPSYLAILCHLPTENSPRLVEPPEVKRC